jgi:hypothetical protein
MTPFNYPAAPHVYRHGPHGYADYSSFRPWLRDEFGFRCVYCLVREQWGRAVGLFDLDHFLPTAHYPEQSETYDNLLYCCVRCNAAKSDDVLPDPRQVLVRGQVEVYPDGTLEARTTEARRLVRTLHLDDRKSTEFRLMWIRIIALTEIHDPPLHGRLIGFPEDLPNLRRLRPPGGNGRPAGIQDSFYARRQAGTLPEAY